MNSVTSVLWFFLSDYIIKQDASLRPYFCLDTKVGKRSRHTKRDLYGLLLIVDTTKLTPCPKGSPSFADEMIVIDSLDYTSTRSLCVVFCRLSSCCI